MNTEKFPYWNEVGKCFDLPEIIPEIITPEMILNASKILVSCAEDIEKSPYALYMNITEMRIKNETRFTFYTLTILMIQKHGPCGCDCLEFLFHRDQRFFRDILGPARKASITPVQDYKILLKNAADEIGVDFKETHKTNLYRSRPDKSPLAD